MIQAGRFHICTDSEMGDLGGCRYAFCYKNDGLQSVRLYVKRVICYVLRK